MSITKNNSVKIRIQKEEFFNMLKAAYAESIGEYVYATVVYFGEDHDDNSMFLIEFNEESAQ